MSVSKKPMVLVILDGYGYREEQQDNAIYSAKTPVMDALWAKRPHTLIDASGLEVGLPDRQMGNSEVGHVNLGAGRIVYQDLTRLDVEIKERTFFSNPVLAGAAVVGAGLLWYAARQREKKQAAGQPIEGSATRVEAKRGNGSRRRAKAAQDAEA